MRRTASVDPAGREPTNRKMLAWPEEHFVEWRYIATNKLVRSAFVGRLRDEGLNKHFLRLRCP